MTSFATFRNAQRLKLRSAIHDAGGGVVGVRPRHSSRRWKPPGSCWTSRA